MTPAVRRLLREHGLTAAQIVGTGGGGRITREDVTNYVESQRTGQPVGGQAVGGAAAPPRHGGRARRPPRRGRPRQRRRPAAAPAPPRRAAAPAARAIEFPAGADEVLVPMTQMRKGIAAQMTRALQAPHAYVQMEVDVTRLVALPRAGEARLPGEGRDRRSASSRSSSRPSAEALKRNPTFNAHWTERRACSPSAGSTSASRSRSTTA